jgi:hypothetical protein
MAPGRKRGAKGAKTSNELSLGDLVLAKVKGFPAWPAKISRPEDWDRTPDPKKTFVQFYGTEEIAFVAPADIQIFTTEAKNKVIARTQGKNVKFFAEAVKEICEEFEESQNDKSSGRGDDTDRSAFGSETSSVDRVGDDTEEFDLKEEIAEEEMNGETEIKRLGEDGGSGLERCSPRHGEMDGHDDLKPSISGDSNDNSSPRKKIKHSNDEANVLVKEEVSTFTPCCNISFAKDEDYSDNKVVDNALSSDQRNTISSAKVSGSAEKPIGVKKEHKSGLKSKKGVISGAKRKFDGAAETTNKLSSSGVLTSSSHDTTNSSEDLKDKKLRKRLVPGGNTKESAQPVKSSDLSGSRKKSKKMVTNEASQTVKQSKGADVKVSMQSNKKNDVPDDKAESKRSSASTTKAQDHAALTGDDDSQHSTKRRRQALESVSGRPISTSQDNNGKISTLSVKVETSGPDKIKSPVLKPHMKRRAVRLYDDDDEDEPPKTPVHGGLTRKVDVPSRPADVSRGNVVKYEKPREDSAMKQQRVSSTKILNGVLSPNIKQSEERHKKGVTSHISPPRNIESEKTSSTKIPIEVLSPNSKQSEEMHTKGVTTHVSPGPRKIESEKLSSKEAKPDFISPVRSSPLQPSPAKPLVEPPKATKVIGNVIEKKVQPGSVKLPTPAFEGKNNSQSQVTSERIKPSSTGERLKTTPKPSSRLSDSKRGEANVITPSERVEARRDDKASSLVDSKIPNSATSMKRLIEVAQAKRKQTHLPNDLPHGATDSVSGPITDVAVGSPSPVFDAQPIVSIPSSTIQANNNCSTSLASPPQSIVIEEFVERRKSSGHRPAVGSLSGGTEAAVSRDAFEGMIETLSRTKESIGRATRLAIDCAKYGIANEVVELLIRKLEGEASLHRRVDLFFLVDSITQCSHSHKGIAGASYIPIVQAALPRLLGAAAPSGSGARENRRQCLKVLRLWLERKILPESVIRRLMDDVGAKKDDSGAPVAHNFRRPSRAERAVDDPIREMEGMLVDEYGSNSTFQLPGLLSSHAFEEEEEEEEEKRYDENLPSSDVRTSSPIEVAAPSTGEPSEKGTPNDMRHGTLEDVDRELEMEDVAVRPKNETQPSVHEELAPQLQQQQFSESVIEEELDSKYPESPPFPVGSPPLPLYSPPPTPPLPSSPSPPPPPPPAELPLQPPPPPPPLSPSPPPPPPPNLPSQQPAVVSFPAGALVSLHHPQPPILVSQPLLSLQSSSVPASSPKLAYQPLPIPRSIVQVAANAPNHLNESLLDTALRNEIMYSQQQQQFAPPGGQRIVLRPSGQGHRPANFASSLLLQQQQQLQQLQQLQQQQLLMQQRPHQLYPPPYSLASSSSSSSSRHEGGPRGYAPEEQPWKISADEHGVWLSTGAGRVSCSRPPYPLEGYFRSPLERQPPATINPAFQSSSVNTHPSVPPLSGQGGPKMLPYRPDMSSLSWKPS